MSKSYHNAYQPLPFNELMHGAVIDSDGREIAITEEMIQRACAELDRAGLSLNPSYPQHPKHAAPSA